MLNYSSPDSGSVGVGSGSGFGCGSVFDSELDWLDELWLDELWLDELDDELLLEWLDEELLEYDGSLYDDCELDELELLSSFFGTVSSGITTSSPYFARGSLLASMKTYPFSVS